MESMDGSKFDTNIISSLITEVSNFLYSDYFVIEYNFLIKKIFATIEIQEICFSLINDIIRIYEKKKVSISLSIEKQNQSGHDIRFTATSSHIIKNMNW